MDLGDNLFEIILCRVGPNYSTHLASSRITSSWGIVFPSSAAFWLAQAGRIERSIRFSARLPIRKVTGQLIHRDDCGIQTKPHLNKAYPLFVQLQKVLCEKLAERWNARRYPPPELDLISPARPKVKVVGLVQILPHPLYP